MLRRPPQHDIEVQGRFIFDHDPAVDRLRIDREKRVMESKQNDTLERLANERDRSDKSHDEIAILEALADEQDPKRHCWEVYQGGETRYDANEEIRSYAPDSTLFVLKRMSRATFRVIQDQIVTFQGAKKVSVSSELRRKFTLEAIRAGVVGVENGEDLGIDFADFTAKDLDALEELHTLLPLSLAFAAFNFSKGLLGYEKKR